MVGEQFHEILNFSNSLDDFVLNNNSDDSDDSDDDNNKQDLDIAVNLDSDEEDSTEEDTELTQGTQDSYETQLQEQVADMQRIIRAMRRV